MVAEVCLLRVEAYGGTAGPLDGITLVDEEGVGFCAVSDGDSLEGVSLETNLQLVQKYSYSQVCM